MTTDPRTAFQPLVDKFAADQAHYASPTGGYKEADTRSEFIDPFLQALGWDVTNSAGVTPSKKDVVREESQEREDSANKVPDYTLRPSGVRRLYLEAKKPSVNVLTHLESVFQARRYGYSGGDPIAVLTNFRDVVVYDTTFAVNQVDRVETGRIYTWNYRDFVTKFDEISMVLGRTQVGEAEWAKQFHSTSPKQPVPAGAAFIRHFNDWRLSIGRDLVDQDSAISQEDLNDAVQRVLNRLIFVRMCEDRGIEGERTLRDAITGGNTTLATLFQRLHRRYNTGLFKARSGTDLALKVRTKVLRNIIDRLYSPLSPFSFAVLDANFLGLVYEASLTEHLVITRRHRNVTVALGVKREYEHRELIATPQELVTATVEESMNALDSAVREPKVLDFALGSGRFLLSVFDKLVERETARQVADGSSNLLKVGANEYRLKFEEKRRLLVDNFFGIDIDFNVVEVAKFSLLVRLLQDENKATLPARGKRSVLPDLANNIVCGNTLVQALNGATPYEEELTNPLDLAGTRLPDRFDLIVGNPPYMKTEDMKRLNPKELKHLQENCKTSFKQFDKYFAFIEFASTKLVQDGVLGVVVPNKWMTMVAAKHLRTLLRTTLSVVRLDNFREVQLFDDRSIYVCSLVARNAKQGTFTYSEPGTLAEYVAHSASTYPITPRHLSAPTDGEWVLPSTSEENRVLRAIQTRSIPLDDAVEAKNGIQTSALKIYVIERPKLIGKFVEFEKNGKSWQVERSVTKPYLADSRNVQSHHEVQPDSLVIFPYETTASAAATSGWEVIPEPKMRRRYPKTYTYLAANRAQLDKRDIAADQRAKAFYIFGRAQATGYAALAPKIIYSVNQLGDKYALDTTGVVYSSGGTGGEVALFARDLGYSLDFVLALLDQAPVEFFLRKRGSVFRGGYYSRGTDVIGDTPIPRLDFTVAAEKKFHDDVSTKMASLRALHMKTPTIPERRKRKHLADIEAMSDSIRDLFLQRWGLKVADINALNP